MKTVTAVALSVAVALHTYGVCGVYGSDGEDWVEGACPVSCGGGLKSRTLNRGTSIEIRYVPCNSQPCPRSNIGGWGEYGPWSNLKKCSKSCGGGRTSQTRTRMCVNYRPGYSYWKNCYGDTWQTYYYRCNTHPCPETSNEALDGGWSVYGSWDFSSTCSVTCDGGTRAIKRYRTCTSPRPAYNGKPCVGKNEEILFTDCNKQRCPAQYRRNKRSIHPFLI